MEHHGSAPVETGAEMDYREHEKTYDRFLAGAKWGSVILAVLMLAMAAGFFSSAGLLGGLVIFVVLSAAAVFLLR